MSRINKIKQITRKKRLREAQTFHYIYEKLLRKIEKTAKSSYRLDSIDYIIPQAVLHYPLYDVKRCFNFIVNKLKRDEFKVTLVEQNEEHFYYKLNIGWMNENEVTEQDLLETRYEKPVPRSNIDIMRSITPVETRRSLDDWSQPKDIIGDFTRRYGNR